MGMRVEEEAALEVKMGNKSKNKKNSEANAPKEMSDLAGAVPNGLEDGFELSKEDRREEKDKKKAEISSDVELDGTCNEDINVKDYAEVDDTYLKEKEKKNKKKKRKLEPLEDNDESYNEIHLGREERRCLQTDDGKDLGKDHELKSRKEKRQRHKEDRRKDKNETLSSQSQMEILKDKDIVMDEVAKEQKNSQEGNIAEMENAEDQTDKKNKKRRRDEEVGDFKGKKKNTAAEEVGKVKGNYDVNVSEKAEKKRKREKKKGKDDLGDGVREMMAKEQGNESTLIENKDFGDSGGKAHSTRNKMQDRKARNGNKGNKKMPNSVETGSEDPKPKMKSKKVRFSGHVEVFPSSDGPCKGKEKSEEEGLVRGKRFSPEEDEMIKESVFNYIEAHGLGEEGLNMVLRCKSYPKIKNCWKEIGAVLPHRPYNAIYYRAHTLFERDGNRSWTAEELELVRKFHEEHGPKWKKLADAIGKYRVHLKDTWRRIKLPNMKKGHWSQEEYQTLFDLVNSDLRMKAFEEKKSKHGMLRDNICWSAISDKLSTRTHPMCCMKWYNQLTSPMVGEGNWADADDYRLLDALFSLDACCIEDVDWDNLLYHRSADLCQKRWKQMVGHIGEHGNKSFAEQVEILSKRYCPDVLEARETWDSKPVVS